MAKNLINLDKFPKEVCTKERSREQLEELIKEYVSNEEDEDDELVDLFLTEF